MFCQQASHLPLWRPFQGHPFFAHLVSWKLPGKWLWHTLISDFNFSIQAMYLLWRWTVILCIVGRSATFVLGLIRTMQLRNVALFTATSDYPAEPHWVVHLQKGEHLPDHLMQWTDTQHNTGFLHELFVGSWSFTTNYTIKTPCFSSFPFFAWASHLGCWRITQWCSSNPASLQRS